MTLLCRHPCCHRLLHCPCHCEDDHAALGWFHSVQLHDSHWHARSVQGLLWLSDQVSLLVSVNFAWSVVAQAHNSLERGEPKRQQVGSSIARRTRPALRGGRIQLGAWLPKRITVVWSEEGHWSCCENDLTRFSAALNFDIDSEITASTPES